MFTLHPVLKNDTVEITRLELCRVLLMRDRQYPWVILVPEREGLRDFDDLNAFDRDLAMIEIDRVSKAMRDAFKSYKLNIAALGNVVEQLHIHIIARFKDDPAWPQPVWGKHPPVDYDEDARADVIKRITQSLDGI